MDQSALERKVSEVEPADLNHVDPQKTEGDGVTARDLLEDFIRETMVENGGTRDAVIGGLDAAIPTGPLDAIDGKMLDYLVEGLGEYLIDDVL